MTTASPVRLTGRDLTFHPESHTYVRPDGVIVPSVTQILRATGIGTDYEAIPGLSALDLELRRQLGTAVHADIHSYDDDDLDLTTVDPRVRPYLDAWITCRNSLGLVGLIHERIVYDPDLEACGTLDGIVRVRDERSVLIDLKIGDPVDAAAQYQTAAYEVLWRAEHPNDAPIDERWAVQLTPDLAIPYRITPYTDWRDQQMFRAFVTTYYAQAARRKERRS